MLVKKIIIILLIVFSCLAIPITLAQDNTQISELQKQINDYQTKLNDLKLQKNSLIQQKQYLDTQISLTTLQIQQTESKVINTENEINSLGSKIVDLDKSLDYLSKLLLKRIVDVYKRRSYSLLNSIIDSDSANDLVTRIKYLKTTQSNNQKLLLQVQNAKLNFEEQKKLREEKKNELDSLKKTLTQQKYDLDNQKIAKQRLINETQNNEQIYQGLLAKAQSEYLAIQGIITGAGTEIQVRQVKKGDVIGSIIAGASCNSSGTHLHFIVQQGSTVFNPFNYLKNIEYRDNSNGDPWSPSGNWDWPISGPIDFHQGFGKTWSIDNTWVGSIYKFHNGIDVSGSSNTLYAIADGTLYKGSYAVGCTLSYVKLVHNDNGISTLYLHAYSQ